MGNPTSAFEIAFKDQTQSVKILANWAGVNFVLKLGSAFKIVPLTDESNAIDLANQEIRIEQSEREDLLWRRLLEISRQ